MHAVIAISEQGRELLYPKWSEIILGAIAFFLLFGFMAKWVLPRVNRILTERQEKIQGDLEKAEQARKEANRQLEEYREQLAGARDEGNRIIEEARRTAEAMRREMTERAEREYQQIVGRAQEEIRAERDRVFQQLRTQIGELSVELAARVVGGTLDRERQRRLVDDYIRDLATIQPSGNGHGGSGAGGEG